MKSNDSISIFPNPTNGILNILSDKIILSIELLGADGRILEKYNNINSLSSRLDLEKYHMGFYLIRVTTSEEEFVKKVVIGK